MQPDVVDSANRPARAPAAGLIGALLAMAAGGNLVVPSMLDAPQLNAWIVIGAGLLWGSLAAELGLLAIWAVLGSRKARVQLPATMLTMLGLYGALLLGLIAAEGRGGPVRDMVRACLFLPLVFLAVQSPLWGLRILGGYRIALRTDREQPCPIESRQVRVRHLLATTALVAVALSLALIGIPQSARAASRAASRPDPAFALLIACALCAAWSALAVLPCVWAAFVARRRGLAATVMAAYMTGLCLVVWGIIQVASRASAPAEVLVALFVSHGTLAAVTLGTLHLLRACGYVLLRASREPRQSLV